ncbi:hypothetical protein BC829DRAFT_378712 [Chytridium lagenaria]|nr:hypothetical protein BC829DRAFT_378712 [Chytridium lagenaria]
MAPCLVECTLDNVPLTGALLAVLALCRSITHLRLLHIDAMSELQEQLAFRPSNVVMGFENLHSLRIEFNKDIRHEKLAELFFQSLAAGLPRNKQSSLGIEVAWASSVRTFTSVFAFIHTQKESIEHLKIILHPVLSESRITAPTVDMNPLEKLFDSLPRLENLEFDVLVRGSGYLPLPKNSPNLKFLVLFPFNGWGVSMQRWELFKSYLDTATWPCLESLKIHFKSLSSISPSKSLVEFFQVLNRVPSLKNIIVYPPNTRVAGDEILSDGLQKLSKLELLRLSLPDKSLEPTIPCSAPPPFYKFLSNLHLCQNLTTLVLLNVTDLHLLALKSVIPQLRKLNLHFRNGGTRLLRRYLLQHMLLGDLDFSDDEEGDFAHGFSSELVSLLSTATRLEHMLLCYHSMEEPMLKAIHIIDNIVLCVPSLRTFSLNLRDFERGAHHALYDRLLLLLQQNHPSLECVDVINAGVTGVERILFLEEFERIRRERMRDGLNGFCVVF